VGDTFKGKEVCRWRGRVKILNDILPFGSCIRSPYRPNRYECGGIRGLCRCIYSRTGAASSLDRFVVTSPAAVCRNLLNSSRYYFALHYNCSND